MSEPPDFVALPAVAWTAPTLASFRAMAAAIDARFGPPCARDLDSNGLGRFDAHCLRFLCGLEVALWRFQQGPHGARVDLAVEPAFYEVYANAPDIAHVAFHLGTALDAIGDAVAAPAFVVMRSDDNGNDVEIRRVTSRCEADALVRAYEARGHKQSYWIAGPA